MSSFGGVALSRAGLLALVIAHAARAAEPRLSDEGIQLALYPGALARVVFDPTRKDDTSFTLEIRNRSRKAIAVPADYDGRAFRIKAISSETRWPLTLFPGERKTPKIIRIDPGQHRVCFKLPLAEILGSGKGGGEGRNSDPARNPKWRWDWRARPRPPASPIHRLRNRELISQVVFWAEVQVENQTLRTEPVIIRVKSP